MALVRVYLTTYRRHNLLPRALNSLLSQTFGDWVCELHNDAPDDPFPQELVRRTADPRITVVTHEVNYGPVRSFNGFFKPISETYLSVLEDDNWWQPNLLERLVAEMQAHPEASLAWGNQRFWKEEPDGSWTDTGRDIWDRPDGGKPEVYEWPQPRHVFGPLHSVGSMVARSARVQGSMVPLTVDFAATEAYRERMYPFPVVFVPERLGNFALTMGTARARNPAKWNASQALLAGSFAATVPIKPESAAAIWRRAWSHGRVKSTPALFVAACAFPGARKLLCYAGLRDWAFTLAYFARHPVQLAKTIAELRRSAEERDFLLRHTRARLREAVQRGFREY